ncbi:MAG: hypothetical protein AN484_15485 [Aphanizomenon flos-aquae WA102]|uniref:NAD-specific glutamate dehydrogenase n=1 Tax=Aphanizomenon flos-aquae WA102 TaxID=1710896 RepID=A0A1B7X0K4_APHFL|nr:MAG: hypothetical protein AN484_15485 [Aphanizomenon flos-aquae WA102]
MELERAQGVVERVGQARDQAVGGGLLAGEDLTFHGLGLHHLALHVHGFLELGVDRVDAFLKVAKLAFVEGRAFDASALELAGLDDHHLDAGHLGGFGVVRDGHVDADGADGAGGAGDDAVGSGANPIGSGGHLGVRVSERRLAEGADLVGKLFDAGDRATRGRDLQGDLLDIGTGGERVQSLGDFVHVHGAHHLLERGQAFADHADDRDDADAVDDVGLRGHAEELREHIREAELLGEDSVVLGLGRVDEEGLAARQSVGEETHSLRNWVGLRRRALPGQRARPPSRGTRGLPPRRR